MSTDAPTSLLSVLLRLFWMLIGPALLFLLLVASLSEGGGWFTSADVAYFLTVAALIAARWIDFQQGHSLTSMGTLATAQDVSRYSAGVAIIAPVLWAVANLIGNR